MPWTKVYSNKAEFESALSDNRELRGLAYKDALLEATSQLLEADETVFVIGEGIDDSGGVFGSTKGLHLKFGRERVMDSPLAENGITGIAIGAAVAGMRPILVHMRVDFIPLSLDQIINHAAKWRYMFGGKVSVPIVIRSMIGRGWGSAAQHSQSLQSLFTNIPGLKVVMPATPYDAKGLLRASVYDGNPVVFIEHRWLYEHMGHVPSEPYTVPLGKAIIRRTGSDATIVAVSYMVYEAMSAADILKNEGIECEVIDLRTLKPLDAPLILESVSKTGRLVIADTGWKETGIGAEIIARVVEDGFGALKSAPERVNLPEAPTPASPALEKAYYPGKFEIAAAVRRAVNKG
ncbi:MAG: acetoin dehydrogenase [Deltaproteobacteria bacterium GWB2_55_19]|nr:MAG: acetoin dehydrogenase [Deltaproteobacteria bacterium GWB2_55_19]HAO93885.1 alpha-ketoacid dehydrogenase subunit beta [Deltaproteobacteria bacterium]